METRIALAACLVIGSTLCGKALSDSSRRRTQTLKAFSEGLRLLRIHMTGMCEPVRNALEHSGWPLFEMVAGSMQSGQSAGEAWNAVRQRALRRGGPVDAMTSGDAQVLDRLFEGLGQSGREEQEALLNGVSETVDALRATAQSRAGESDRLYVTLGFLMGLMLALIVL